jgi:dTDP-4-amino-4,6-dideoxygalactose transaminase
MLQATKTFLPPIEEYNNILKRIWDNGWITNRGELVVELENKLKNFLQLDNILITNNGTFPLQVAIKLFGKNTEIITTPYSYVASTSSIVWENCTPVFVDIDPEHLTIDETKIESCITNKTSAILATHLYGNVCNIEAIERIAKKHSLKVIYDAAHCFGVKYKGNSIFNYGDISTCSFHATKIFHTGEGGAIICNDKELIDQVYYSHNFGHNGLYDFHGLGINGKISELQAAMGLAVFNHINTIFTERKKVVEFYNNHLDFSKVKTIKYREGLEQNYSYYPVIFASENDLLKTEKKLNEVEIFTRRNFFPSLNKLNYVSQIEMPIAEDVSRRTTCIPLSVGIEEAQLDLICKIINSL